VSLEVFASELSVSVGRSCPLWLKVHPPLQFVEAKEKTSFCSSLRFLICKLTLTPAGKVAGARPLIVFPDSSVSVELQALERIFTVILNILEWKLLHMEIRALARV
jgi:hypothetical protein